MSNIAYCEFSKLAEVASSIASEEMSVVLEQKKYLPNKCSEWSDVIGKKVIERLKVLAPLFKFIVSTLVLQKVGAGLYYESVGHWDPKVTSIRIIFISVIVLQVLMN